MRDSELFNRSSLCFHSSNAPRSIVEADGILETRQRSKMSFFLIFFPAVFHWISLRPDVHLFCFQFSLSLANAPLPVRSALILAQTKEQNLYMGNILGYLYSYYLCLWPGEAWCVAESRQKISLPFFPLSLSQASLSLSLSLSLSRLSFSWEYWFFLFLFSL